jgi:Ion channel
LVALLILGYALVYWPHLPADFNVQEKAQSSSGIEALYFSGITFTTLGYGDIAPRSTPMRLLALSEALTGFGFISLAVTYLVSLTAALERKRAVALSFYHQARQGADVAGLLINHFVGGRFVGLESIFAGAARDLQGLLESHIEHPLIHYFHPTHVQMSAVESKPATFFPLNRSEMFWQGVTRRFLGKSSGKELDFDGFEVDCGVVAGSFAFDA